MNLVNAIAKARFSSAKGQRVQLHKADHLQAELLCMEAGQDMDIPGGPWVYYVITGTAAIGGGANVGQGQMLFVENEPHQVKNAEQRRLLVLAVGG